MENQSQISDLFKIDDNESQMSKQTQVTMKQVRPAQNSLHLNGHQNVARSNIVNE